MVLQTTSLHSLVDYFNVNMKMLSDAATMSQPTKQESKAVIALQRSSYGGGPSPLLKSTDRSVSLPPGALTKSPKKVRRLLSAPRRLQAGSTLTPANPPKKGYEGLLTANLTAFSLVLVQRGSASAGILAFLQSGCRIFGSTSVFHSRCSRQKVELKSLVLNDLLFSRVQPNSWSRSLTMAE